MPTMLAEPVTGVLSNVLPVSVACVSPRSMPDCSVLNWSRMSVRAIAVHVHREALTVLSVQSR